MKSETLMEKRFLDLSRQAYTRDFVTFSDFLTLQEQSILKQNTGKYFTQVQVFGGYPDAEHQIAAFIPDMDAEILFGEQEESRKAALFSDFSIPIVCQQITPLYPKFAEKITHRDILGAVMNLGIERSKIGDILVSEDAAYLFCKKEISDYISEQLTQIRHTGIRMMAVDAAGLDIRLNLEPYEAIVASNRIDCVVAAMTKLSRSAAVSLIQSGKVFVQGNACQQNTYLCKSGDILSIRGYGKFQFTNICGQTKKNRRKIQYKKYI